jgi:glycosyltransferase involved in cell wall biosynthesis
MQPEPKVLLVAPYEGDEIGSIERFSRCLERELRGKISFEIFWPRRAFARFVPRGSAADKWLGYIDKFFVVPRQVRPRAGRADVIHYSDQSSAIHARRPASRPQLLTCADLLAIRSARGEFAQHRTRWTGRRLQSLIAAGIERCDRVACISEATRGDLLRCVEMSAHSVSVVPMGLHRGFRPVAREDALPIVSRYVPAGRFVLHVGGNQWYKNRRGVLEIYASLAKEAATAPNLVLVGAPLSAELRGLVQANSWGSKVYSVANCDDEHLAAFYSAAELLLFPSLNEGFGWPILEAQACACRVVTTDREPMSEVAGGGAELIDPAQPEQSARAVARLLEESSHHRAARIDLGLRNVERYSTSGMIAAYLDLYRSLAAKPCGELVAA